MGKGKKKVVNEHSGNIPPHQNGKMVKHSLFLSLSITIFEKESLADSLDSPNISDKLYGVGLTIIGANLQRKETTEIVG
ncbi:hypothetical protein ACOSP7_010111 [Xanthoceras sorbifolium]